MQEVCDDEVVCILIYHDVGTVLVVVVVVDIGGGIVIIVVAVAGYEHRVDSVQDQPDGFCATCFYGDGNDEEPAFVVGAGE